MYTTFIYLYGLLCHNEDIFLLYYLSWYQTSGDLAAFPPNFNPDCRLFFIIDEKSPPVPFVQSGIASFSPNLLCLSKLRQLPVPLVVSSSLVQAPMRETILLSQRPERAALHQGSVICPKPCRLHQLASVIGLDRHHLQLPPDLTITR